MLDLTMTVTFEDGRTVATAVAPRTQVAFEQEHNVGIGVIGTQQRVGHLYWLAWHAMKTGQSFDDWLDTVRDIEIEVADAVPLPEGQSPT